MNMNKFFMIAIAATVLSLSVSSHQAEAGRRWHGGPGGTTVADRWAARRAAQVPWHGQYYSPQWGRPVAVVLPPTVKTHTTWSWGVAGTRVTPVYHQFGRAYPGKAQGRMRLRPTPAWPSNTGQLGYYPIRGPW